MPSIIKGSRNLEVKNSFFLFTAFEEVRFSKNLSNQFFFLIKEMSETDKAGSLLLWKLMVFVWIDPEAEESSERLWSFFHCGANLTPIVQFLQVTGKVFFFF